MLLAVVHAVIMTAMIIRRVMMILMIIVIAINQISSDNNDDADYNCNMNDDSADNSNIVIMIML